jgi:NADH:ubiquinone oxidoreductase subunit B-like Fe-S oxidoreductase
LIRRLLFESVDKQIPVDVYLPVCRRDPEALFALLSSAEVRKANTEMQNEVRLKATASLTTAPLTI